jgi:hypothetical protein
MVRKENYTSNSKTRRRAVIYKNSQISTGLLSNLVEQFLEATKVIGQNDQIRIEWPWKEEMIPFKVYKEQEVKVIKHG